MELLNLENFSQKIANGVVVVDYFAERCPPCKMILPYVIEMSEKLAGRVEFYKVNVDLQQQLSVQQWIRSMPTFQIFKDWKLQKQIIWADTKWLRQWIHEVLDSK